MFKRMPALLSGILLFSAMDPSLRASAQEPTSPPAAPESVAAPPQAPAPQPTVSPATAVPQADKIALPAGTHLPLVLQNGINTRTAKSGDFVYFVTVYPIAQNDRIVIPMGTFVRGQLLSAKRPGLVKGRGEFRMALEQMTFPNGYTIALTASPNSVDTDGKAGVDQEGTIKGPASTKRDAGIMLATTAGGAYIGTLAGAINSGSPGKGAGIGAGIGGLAGLAVILLTRGPEAELQRGTTMDAVFVRALLLDADHLSPSDPGKYSPPPAPVAHERESRRRRQSPGNSLLRTIIPLMRF